jgi:AhpD family alkylhydroperoxidase
MTKTISSEIIKERGSLANIHKAFLKFPEGMDAHFKFYKSILLKDNLPLNRGQIEFLATETSKANQCSYCIHHHQKAFENSKAKIPQDEQLLFRELAESLSQSPWKSSVFKEKFIKNGLSEEKYLHAILIVSYFNMANRLAFANDLELEEDFSLSCH